MWAATAPEVPDKFRDTYVTRKGSKVVQDKWAGLALDEDVRKELWATAGRIVAEKLAAGAPAPKESAPPATEAGS